jgi:hypothetical protein
LEKEKQVHINEKARNVEASFDWEVKVHIRGKGFNTREKAKD